MTRVGQTLLSPWASLAVSVALRVAYLLQIRGSPFFDVPVMDEGYHDLWARELASGDWASRLPFRSSGLRCTRSCSRWPTGSLEVRTSS
jgi:hypothetical protein